MKRIILAAIVVTIFTMWGIWCQAAPFLVSIVPGTYGIRARACRQDVTWGTQCGPEGSFTLTCPSNTFTAPVLSITP